MNTSIIENLLRDADNASKKVQRRVRCDRAAAAAELPRVTQLGLDEVMTTGARPWTAWNGQ